MTTSGRIPKYRRKTVGKRSYACVTLTDVDTGERRDVIEPIASTCCEPCGTTLPTS